MDNNFDQKIQKIREKDPRYHTDAYTFVNAAVSYTVERCERAKKPRGSRHVSGQELTEGIMDYAVSQFSFLASDVLDNWGLRSGSDAGNIVYNMIGAELLSAGPEDSRHDFECHPDLIQELREKTDSCLQIPEPPAPPVVD